MPCAAQAQKYKLSTGHGIVNLGHVHTALSLHDRCVITQSRRNLDKLSAFGVLYTLQKYHAHRTMAANHDRIANCLLYVTEKVYTPKLS